MVVHVDELNAVRQNYLTTSKTPDEGMLEIEYEGGTLRATASHRVWSATRGTYIEARNIVSNGLLRIGYAATK